MFNQEIAYLLENHKILKFIFELPKKFKHKKSRGLGKLQSHLKSYGFSRVSHYRFYLTRVHMVNLRRLRTRVKRKEHYTLIAMRDCQA